MWPFKKKYLTIVKEKKIDDLYNWFGDIFFIKDVDEVYHKNDYYFIYHKGDKDYVLSRVKNLEYVDYIIDTVPIKYIKRKYNG